MKNQAVDSRPSLRSVLSAIACLLPLALLLVAFAAGISIPFWLYLPLLVACLLMPLWSKGHDPEGAPRGAHACGMGDHLPREFTPRPDDVRALRSIGDAADPRTCEANGGEVTPAGLVLRGRFHAGPQDVQRHLADVSRETLGRKPQVLVQEDADGAPFVLIADEELERRLAVRRRDTARSSISAFCWRRW